MHPSPRPRAPRSQATALSAAPTGDPGARAAGASSGAAGGAGPAECDSGQDCARGAVLQGGSRPASAAPGGLPRSLSAGSAASGGSGVTSRSGATSRYSRVVLISAEEFDMSLEGARLGGARARAARAPRHRAPPQRGGPCASRRRAQAFTHAARTPLRAAAAHAWLRAQYRVRLLVESGAFTNLFLAAILANTVVLAIEHDGMSPTCAGGDECLRPRAGC